MTLALATEDGCALAIGFYPRFRYDGRGGGGVGLTGESLGGGWQALAFEPASLAIPPLNSRTTRLLWLPLPPGLEIAIHPEKLEGRWNPGSGELELTFLARFALLLAARPVAPDLIVATQLATHAVRGQRHQAQGTPLDGQGRGVLVGVARVAPTGEGWVDRFLQLPDEALAVLHCRLAPFEETD
jgi:hypothetical protein